MKVNKEEVISLFEKKLNEKFDEMEDLEEVLSEMFQEALENQGDAQLAFNDVDDEVNGLLSEYFVYTLSEKGSMWSVGVAEKYEEIKKEEYLKIFREHYHESFETLDDMLSKIEHRVMKDMDNVGCDAKTALRMILEEDLDLEDVFCIIGADAEPRIEFFLF